jgi:putative RNA 2'-phosphotransferase
MQLPSRGVRTLRKTEPRIIGRRLPIRLRIALFAGDPARVDRDRRRRLSKWLSYVLRHHPEEAGLELDPRGCAPIGAITLAATSALGMTVTAYDLELLSQPAFGEQKQRFEIEGEYIRAGHGHSIPIAEYHPVIPKAPLYHGAPRAVLDDILQAGLQPMSRDKVHLSYDRAITLEAARRKSTDVALLEIDVEKARAAGVGFYRSADARIVLADPIPPGALTARADTPPARSSDSSGSTT